MGGDRQYLSVATLLLPPMSVDSIHEMGPRERLAFLQGEVRRLQAKCNRYEDIVANMALGILEVDT